MKRIVLVAIMGLLSMSLLAQGKSGNKGKSKNNPATEQTDNPGKSKDKEKNKKNDNTQNDEHDRKVWDGIGDKSCMKPSKNQPAKVRASFQRDYPNALNVRWTKCRGDWTATFSGSLFRSTAVYHANGDRRDTRTPVNKENIPRKILDEIFKKRPDTRLDEAIKIEMPNVVKEIFRIKNIFEGKTEFEYYDSDGNKVQYDY